jgi:hypothetical protein
MSAGCKGISNKKWENTAMPIAVITERPYRTNGIAKRTDHMSTIAKECDHPISSHLIPGGTPGVIVTFSIPANTKEGNRRSKATTATSKAHVGALGSRAFIA